MNNKYIVESGLQRGYLLGKLIDRGVYELIGPYGLTLFFINGARLISKLDTGIITSYALYIVFSIVIIIFILFGFVLIPGQDLDFLFNFTFENQIRLFIIYLASLFILLVL